MRRSLSVFGTYTIDEANKTVTYNIVSASFPNREGELIDAVRVWSSLKGSGDNSSGGRQGTEDMKSQFGEASHPPEYLGCDEYLG